MNWKIVSKLIILIYLKSFTKQLLAQEPSLFKLTAKTSSFNNQNIWLTNAGLNANFEISFGLKVEQEIKTIFDNAFEFNGKIIYSTPAQIGWLYEKENRVIFSDVFLIEQGTIQIKVDSINEKPIFIFENVSKANEEIFKIQKLIGGIHQENDSSLNTLWNYVKLNPSSYPAFCILSVIYYRNGFHPIMSDILNEFSGKIGLLIPFKEIDDLFYSERNLADGQSFPFQNVSFGRTLKKNSSVSQFTLLEFWATWCGPCLQQIPDWKNIYRKFSKNDITIIGIALERTKETKSLNKFIQKEKIKWKNIVDLKGIESSKLLIREIPSNILINNDGKIIQRNITPNELEIVLQNHSNY